MGAPACLLVSPGSQERSRSADACWALNLQGSGTPDASGRLAGLATAILEESRPGFGEGRGCTQLGTDRRLHMEVKMLEKLPKT